MDHGIWAQARNDADHKDFADSPATSLSYGAWICRWFQRSSIRKRKDVESLVPLQAYPGHPNQDGQHDFRSMIGPSDWYVRFLREKVQQIPTEILRLTHPSLDGGREESVTFLAMNSFLYEVAKMLSEEPYLSLKHIISHFETKQDKSFMEEERALAFQLCFIALGLITMLYSPNLQPVPGMLEILDRSNSVSKSPRNKTWNSFRLSVDQAEGSFSDVLQRMGNLNGPIPHPAPSSPGQRPPEDALRVSNLKFYTLSKFAHIDVIWIDSVCMHLEFDDRNKVLKLFRFPSFCEAVCANEEYDTFLAQLFNDYLMEGVSDSDRDTVNIRSRDFFREIIFSYRLIFGQNADSWKLFQKEHATRKNKGSCSYDDPLLPKLCGGEWSREDIYEVLDAPPARSIYSASADFPYFGKRLIAIQDCVLIQNPSDWETLWYDRRDLSRFSAIWAVLIFGVVTILMGIVQIALSAAQVGGTFPKSTK
ncbi:hypothetical protein BP5796_06484 [Coleophoma crateriformis]|uniref:Uncharacterized protein n=1 Tax=Coleophoma crateriformis TaxID=565419 RepID=A0A3D8RNP1_9HELO|nr:hypothetical protein BP5796_06484 [Coleophoma crateriformis]